MYIEKLNAVTFKNTIYIILHNILIKYYFYCYENKNLILYFQYLDQGQELSNFCDVIYDISFKWKHFFGCFDL